MNLYLISQSVNGGYDTYDSAVVAAKSEDAAQKVSPSEYYVWHDDGGWHFKYSDGSEKAEGAHRYDWAEPSKVKAELIGVAVDGTEAGTVICASFNAG